jgi:hypothetical protein
MRLALSALIVAALALPAQAAGYTTAQLDSTAVSNRSVGKLFVTKPSVTVKCTASVVDAPNRSILVTAGHCLKSAANGSATGVRFVPGYHDGLAPFGEWSAAKIVSAPQWDTVNLRYDFGFIVAARNAQGVAVEDAVGALPIAFNQPRQQAYRIFGYPYEPTPKYDGQKLWACETAWSADVGDPFPGPPQIRAGCDFGGGASGGPSPARSRAALHHSLNYRSAMVLGTAREVTDPGEKQVALRAVVEHIAPGRPDEVRGPDETDLKSTRVLSIAIEEASAKVRTGPPIDEEADLDLPHWAGQPAADQRSQREPRGPRQHQELVSTLGREALFELRPPLGRLFLPVLRGSVGDQRVEQLPRRGSDLLDGAVERLGVRLRRLVRSADLADELKGRVVDFLLGRGGLEVMELSDVSAHVSSVAMSFRAAPGLNGCNCEHGGPR